MHGIGAFMSVRNAIRRGCPLLEVLYSILPAVDLIVILDGESTDGTLEFLEKAKEINKKIRIIKQPWLDLGTSALAIGESESRALALLKDLGEIKYVMKVQGDDVWTDKAISDVIECATAGLLGYSLIYKTLDTFEYIRMQPTVWTSRRFLFSSIALNPKVISDGCYLSTDRKITPGKFIKLNSVIFNLGYVFPENIVEKWKQNKEIAADFLSQFGGNFDGIDPATFDYKPNLDAFKSVKSDPSEFPPSFKRLSGLRRYSISDFDIKILEGR